VKNSKLEKQYITIHNQMINEYGLTEKALWGSKKSQYVRFNKLLDLFLTKASFSVLDIGCGLCDFYEYIQQKGFSNFNYTGIEINKVFYLEAKKRYPSLDIRNGSFNQLKKTENWDYVIASGIFNLGDSQSETMELFFNQFGNIYSQIKIGFGVNFLSAYHEKQDNISVYHCPTTLFLRCMQEFSKHVVLDHSYLPNDFTILVYKDLKV
jgi:SAM-dependent methyltransferase